MKRFDIYSFVIGLLGSSYLAHLINQLDKAYVKAQELEGFVQLGLYTGYSFEILITSQIIGISFGIISIKKKLNKKISFLGTIICLLNLAFLFYTW